MQKDERTAFAEAIKATVQQCLAYAADMVPAECEAVELTKSLGGHKLVRVEKGKAYVKIKVRIRKRRAGIVLRGKDEFLEEMISWATKNLLSQLEGW